MDLSKYLEINTGISPIILSCVHGGFKKPRRIPDKLIGPQIADKNTYIIAKQIIKKLQHKSINIYYIFNKIHRSKVDLNRPPRSNAAFYQHSNEARSIHNAFHDQLIRFAQECVLKYKRCLLIDFHGFSKPYENYPDVIFGHIFGNTLALSLDLHKEDCTKYWGCFELHEEISKRFILDDGLGYRDVNLAYSGGYITQQFYNKPNINAIQIELAKYIRFDFDLSQRFINLIVAGITKSVLHYQKSS